MGLQRIIIDLHIRNYYQGSACLAVYPKLRMQAKPGYC